MASNAYVYDVGNGFGTSGNTISRTFAITQLVSIGDSIDALATLTSPALPPGITVTFSVILPREFFGSS